MTTSKAIFTAAQAHESPIAAFEAAHAVFARAAERGLDDAAARRMLRAAAAGCVAEASRLSIDSALIRHARRVARGSK